MKRTLFIFILIVSKLFAQVNAPDLRCLRVLPSGDVVLSWIPPSDPSNQFFSYEVYQSQSKKGTYTLLGSVNSVGTATFVHTTTITITNTSYYYVLTKYGSSGINSSKSSDTLNTIFLNTSKGTVAINLPYKPLHIPKLPSSADLYVINKEYPLGTWNILASLTNTTYPDTLNICVEHINYQVSLMDASGCQSTSNLIVGTFTNTKAPEQPYVDSISVLPNGYTIIAWKIPLDKDIDRYNIQYKVGNTNVFIDSVIGRNVTSYTYTTPTANSSTVGLYVQAQDSCGLGGTVNYEPMSMFLRSSYNRCAYQTSLKWNRYTWAENKGQPKESTKEYRIYYSVNGSGFAIVGSTSDTNFIHSSVAPGKSICYFVRVVNQSENITASSNRSCFFSDQVEAPAFIYLKTATTVDKSAIEVRAFIDNSKSSSGITIQRSENASDFTDVGFIPYTGEAHYSFTDATCFPDSKSYFYRALIIDSCGNIRNPSNNAKTILLKVHEDEDNIFTKQLSWNEYMGFGGGVSGYNVYRIINGDISTALIGSTDALTTSYTDDIEGAASKGAKIEYLVQAVEGIGNSYGIFERSSSNLAPVYMEGNLYVPNAFSPQGVNKTWLPVTHFIEKTDYHVSVFNRWGKKVFETSDDQTGWDGANCIAGVYVYLIDYKNARGEYLEIKGNVLLLR